MRSGEAGRTDFNPPTPCGVGRGNTMLFRTDKHFNPPTPCGVGRRTSKCRLSIGDFNPPTPCGVGPGFWAAPEIGPDFNPPTPCGVGRRSGAPNALFCCISIHPPRVGWDYTLHSWRQGVQSFQSTHPVWGGTLAEFPRSQRRHISIHPPRVGWDADV